MYLLNQTIDELPGLTDTHAGLRHGDLGRTPFDKFKVLNSKRRMCSSCAAALLTATCSMCRVLSPCVRDIVGKQKGSQTKKLVLEHLTRSK